MEIRGVFGIIVQHWHGDGMSEEVESSHSLKLCVCLHHREGISVLYWAPRFLNLGTMALSRFRNNLPTEP